MDAKGKEKLFRLWKFFAWMDDARQGLKENDRWIDKWHRCVINKAWKLCDLNDDADDLTSADIVLAHWLTYIFDYQMPTEDVWNKIFPIMAYMVFRYRKGDTYTKIIDEHIFQRDNNFEFRLCKKGEFSFKHRFGGKHGLNRMVKKTLKELEGYGKSLVAFMLEKSNNAAEHEWVRTLYGKLYTLTYGVNGEIYWWHKRCWSALRDYLKGPMYRIYVCDALKEFKSYRSAIEKWSNPEPYLYQLELPGDIWNTEFFNRIYDDFIAPLTEDHKAPIAPRALRDIYKKFSDELRERGLYPEQFDVTFDFARLCREKSCYMCPLSPKHPYVEKLCIGNLSRPKQKYCSLLLTICEYFTLCNPDKCPVFDKSIKGLCPKPEIY